MVGQLLGDMEPDCGRAVTPKLEHAWGVSVALELWCQLATAAHASAGPGAASWVDAGTSTAAFANSHAELAGLVLAELAGLVLAELADGDKRRDKRGDQLSGESLALWCVGLLADEPAHGWRCHEL